MRSYLNSYLVVFLEGPAIILFRGIEALFNDFDFEVFHKNFANNQALPGKTLI